MGRKDLMDFKVITAEHWIDSLTIHGNTLISSKVCFFHTVLTAVDMFQGMFTARIYVVSSHMV